MSRSLGRDVFVFDSNYPDQQLGGLMLNPSITQRIFLQMLEILLAVESPYQVVRRGPFPPNKKLVTLSEEALEPGQYDVHAEVGDVRVSDEVYFTRFLSPSNTAQEPRFINEVRDRDRKCVISGVALSARMLQRESWESFHAAHIFPKAQASHFYSAGYSRCITDGADPPINSVQNGMLLSANIHHLFDAHLVSCNPDADYKIICFEDDVYNISGRQLDLACRQPGDARAVRDVLLRFHFRQSVLANMRGAGEPLFETDFADGDMMGQILAGPKPAERMEAELAERLYGHPGLVETDANLREPAASAASAAAEKSPTKSKAGSSSRPENRQTIE